MKLIVGLGNPGEKYQNNRHNAGYMFADYIADMQKAPFTTDKYTQSQQARIENHNVKIILAKPQTFMNLSGTAVKKIIENCKLKIENLYLVHDDLDLPLGEYKIQKGKGPKLHHGVLSVEKAVGTADFWRVRIGVDNRDPDHRISGDAYVLHNFSSGEKQLLITTFYSILQEIGL